MFDTITDAEPYVTNSSFISVSPLRVSVVSGRYCVISSSTLTQFRENTLKISAKINSRKNKFLLSTINAAILYIAVSVSALFTTDFLDKGMPPFVYLYHYDTIKREIFQCLFRIKRILIEITFLLAFFISQMNSKDNRLQSIICC